MPDKILKRCYDCGFAAPGSTALLCSSYGAQKKYRTTVAGRYNCPFWLPSTSPVPSHFWVLFKEGLRG